MSLEIIKCVKTLEQRLEEYMDIFGDKPLKAVEVLEQLHYFVELFIEAAGWQALWKIPRRKCQELKIAYPVTVFVLVHVFADILLAPLDLQEHFPEIKQVKDVDFKGLTATVEIVGVQDDIQLNDEEEAQLINLYPTKQQQYSSVDAVGTADILDKLRFFHHHIWLPWDEENEDLQWTSTVLLPRMQLHYDLATGEIPHEAAKHIHSLLEEARELGLKRKLLEEQSEEEDDVDDNAVYDLMQLHKRLEVIKCEIEMLQYPEFRSRMVNKIKQKAKEEAAGIRMVLNSGTVDDLIKSLTDAKHTIDPQAVISSYPSLHCALNLANPGDTILLCPGEHNFQNIEALEQGGTIKGFSEPSTTIVTANNASHVMLQCVGPSLCLEKLTVNAQSVLTVLSVKQGMIQLKECNIVGMSSSNAIDGIVLSGNGYLEATGCTFVDFSVGITIASGAKAVLNNCSISNCMIGIRLLDDASLMLKHCKVSNCLDYGIKMETKKSDKMHAVGSFALLESVEQVKYVDLVLEGNKKGDVCIQRCPEDLLSDED